jgi:osmotically-inducible protein OsmY
MLRTTDAQIKEDLIRELGHDPRPGATNIEISVDRYVVTLTGTVESVTNQLLIQDAAWRIEGAMGVVNNLKVESPASVRTDAEIAHEVRRALEWDTLLTDANIQFTVSNGWVGLEGAVNLSRERAGAERLVRRLAGVRGVYNNIVVNSSEVNPENVCDTIGEELRHRAELEARSIQVLLKDGTVTLSGQVHSWEERCAIINAASRAPGVEAVKDSLAIKPSF